MNQPPPPSQDVAPREPQPRPWYRLAFFSLLGGSTSLIPVPFVDDWTLDWVRRRMILELAGSIQLSEEAVKALVSRGETFAGGCLKTMIWTPFRLVIYVLKRLFRKIIFILAIKESTDRASAVFHEGYLLASAARRPDLHPLVRRGQPEAVRQMALSVVETMRETDTSPIRLLVARSLRGSRRLLFVAARSLRRMMPKTKRLDAEPEGWEAREESLLGALSQELADSLARQRRYFDDLEATFEACAGPRDVIVNPDSPVDL